MAQHLDMALLEMFAAEVETHMAALNDGVLALEQNPHQSDRFEALMRAAHSIKGAAKLVGLPDAVEIAHVIEDCFVAASAGQTVMTSALADVLLEGVDLLGRATRFDLPEEERVTRQQIAETLERISLQSSQGADKELPKAPVAKAAAPASRSRFLRLPSSLDARWVQETHREVASLHDAQQTIDLDFSNVLEIDPVGLAYLAVLCRSADAGESAVRFRQVAATFVPLLRAAGISSALVGPVSEG